MTKEREALRMALDALEEAHYKIEHKQDATKREQSITAIREALAKPIASVEKPIDFKLAYGEIYKDQRAALAKALAQPKQEPVGHIYTIAGVQHCTIEQVLPDGPLYTTPPKRQPLTDEQVDLIAHNTDLGDWNSIYCQDSWRLGFIEGFREAEIEHEIKGNHK